MSRRIVVLRPEPGNAATMARASAMGLNAVQLPLFAVHGVAWQAPDPDDYQALLLTSANAVRHGGKGLTTLAGLPVLAVGAATAEAARRAGFTVMLTGRHGAAALIGEADAAGVTRVLHLGGRERMIEAGGIVTDVLTVYATEALDIPAVSVAAAAGAVALLHSARAAQRWRMLASAAGIRARVWLACLSAAVADAAGEGWAGCRVARVPTDAALLEAARTLAD